MVDTMRIKFGIDPVAGIYAGIVVVRVTRISHRQRRSASLPSRRVGAFSPNGARFHSEGRSPGNDGTIKQSQAPTGRDPSRRATWCHPVGVKKSLIGRVPRALPWPVEYDPDGVGNGDAVASSSPEGARFHSEWRSPGNGRSPGKNHAAPNQSQAPTGRDPWRRAAASKQFSP